MTTNEFERDLNDQAGLKRPGRIDLRVLQNTADAGDGHPGVQRCFRNYLHEGGMEKDLDLLGFSIKGTSVLIDNAEMQQLSNIGVNTISPTQWGYVGGADQSVKIADSPTFVGLTLSADIVTTSTVDGVDVSDLKDAFDALDYYTQAQVDAAVATKATEAEAIAAVLADDKYVRNYQSDVMGGDLTVPNIICAGVVDNVNVSDLKDAYDAYIIAEHTREITPIYMIPEDGYTAGNDYVYYGGSNIFPTFGSNSYVANHYLYVNFKLPSDYADGEDITIKLNVRTDDDTSTAYSIECRRFRNGDGESGYSLATLTGDWANAAAGPFYDESATFTGAELVGDDGIRLLIKLKGTTYQTDISQIQKIVLVIPVNTRD